MNKLILVEKTKREQIIIPSDNVGYVTILQGTNETPLMIGVYLKSAVNAGEGFIFKGAPAEDFLRDYYGDF